MLKKTTLVAVLLMAWTMSVVAQEQTQTAVEAFKPTAKINGTLRAKFEYQTEEQEQRFEVRTARVSFSGKIHPLVEYKAEIDLCDEGSMKMLDAYTRLKLGEPWRFTIGQMRVPFTIDAHRSPHLQYFANRSFIAKQVGNVRDVGASIKYTAENGGNPIVVEAGLFNGSGLANQKNFWTNDINFSAKAQFNWLQKALNLTLSVQKVKPTPDDDELTGVRTMMYDAGTYYEKNGWHFEVEYLFKQYEDDAHDDVNALDVFACYDIKTPNIKFFEKISPLVRYDYMSDHSDGKKLTVESDGTKVLATSDYERSRLTAGCTFSISKPFISDIRVNYEQYFYDNDDLAKTSEKNKFVIEFVTRF